MKNSPEAITPSLDSPSGARPPIASAGLRNFIVSVVVLVVAFSLPLYGLTRLALKSELYSHVILVPFISLYLVWMMRQTLPAHSAPDLRLAVFPIIAGGTLLVLRLIGTPELEDALALTTLAFVLLFWGLCAVFLGRATLRAIAFPLGFLLFMAPFPTVVTNWIETFLQNHSASAAHLFFKVAGATVFRQETYFELPGIKLLVAPECSGIHSTLALFITSLIASYFFLRSPWKRAVLVLAIIPLAILRNGLRIFVIGELCVHIGPEMIDSPIHHRGGPIFFALSLVPLLLLLWLLRKSESAATEPAPATA